MTTFAERAAREVVDMHHRFVALFTGRGGEPDAVMKRLAPTFVRVGPDGAAQDRSAVAAMLAGASAAADFRIGIDIEAAEPVGDGAVVRYVERQSGKGGGSARRATAVFVAADDGAPLWLAVQETWIEEEEGDDG